jgi:hypothetical protein
MPSRFPNGPSLQMGDPKALSYVQSSVNGQGSCSTRTFLIDELGYSDADLGPDVACGNYSSPTVPCPGQATANSPSPPTGPNTSSLSLNTVSMLNQTCTPCVVTQYYIVIVETPCDPNAGGAKKYLAPSSQTSVSGTQMSGDSCVTISWGGLVDNCQAEEMIDAGTAAGYGSFTSYSKPVSPNPGSTASSVLDCACCLATNQGNMSANAGHCGSSAGSNNPKHGGMPSAGTGQVGGGNTLQALSGTTFDPTQSYGFGDEMWDTMNNPSGGTQLCKFIKRASDGNSPPKSPNFSNTTVNICCPASFSGGTTTQCTDGTIQDPSGAGCCSGNIYSNITRETGSYCSGSEVTISTSNYSAIVGQSPSDWNLKVGDTVCTDVQTYSRCSTPVWQKVCCCGQADGASCQTQWTCS